MSKSIQARLAKGTRDFSPEDMRLRNYIFRTIRKHFESFGFNQIETPAVENLETLTGKYGEEGDKLIFKILNSGDFLSKVDEGSLANADSNDLIPKISEKALRYDLTVPFARYVVQHRNDISFPFRRYQIQPVWRADRPQKGRYREFFQCDADIIGSDSLIAEAEFVSLTDQVFRDLSIGAIVKINSRKILSGLCEKLGILDRFQEFTVILDKLDKKSWDDLAVEFRENGFSDDVIDQVEKLTESSGKEFNEANISALKPLLQGSSTGESGLHELNEISDMLKSFDISHIQVQLDLTLARGLNYYTGAIVEVVASEHQIGSICGGGRYDDLTGIFGVDGLSGMGISFGIDRIFDILKIQGWREDKKKKLIMLVNFGPEVLSYNLEMLNDLRNNDIQSVIYPEADKMKKQFKYADQNDVDFVLIAGSEEKDKGVFSVKNLKSGDQHEIERGKVAEFIRNS